MQRPLQITFRGVRPSAAMERRIHEKVAELERFSQQIIGCHVTVELPHQHHQTGNLYSVRVVMHLPDKDIVAGRDHHDQHSHEDPYVAIRDSFAALTRRLEDYARRRRREVKQHEQPMRGTVLRLFRDDGYGFVEVGDGGEVYFHENSVAQRGFDSLMVGDEVRVVVSPGDKGVQAAAVVPTGRHFDNTLER